MNPGPLSTPPSGAREDRIRANRRLIASLAAVWEQVLEQRFGQFVMNLTRDSEGRATPKDAFRTLGSGRTRTGIASSKPSSRGCSMANPRQRTAPTEREGWYGGLLVEFGPDVTGEQVSEFLAAMCRAMKRNTKVEVVKASFQGPRQEGVRV